MTDKTDETAAARWAKGLEVMDQVYGPGIAEMMKGKEGSPFVSETVSHVFADVWAMPSLSIKEKRLLVLGATAMLGRADLVAIQVAGALHNNELTDEQLEELSLLLLFYVGAGNSTALYQGIQQAKAKHREKK